MNTASVLDIAIGIIFVVMLLSLIVTGLQEILSHLFDLRFKGLKEGLTALLLDGEKAALKVDSILSHPVVRGLTRGQTARPAYIPTHTFVQAFIDRLGEAARVPLDTLDRANATADQLLAKLPESDLKKTLLSIGDHGRIPIAEFEKRVARHFDDAMSRVGGWYKRSSCKWLFGLGLIAATILNADMVMMARHLAQDSHARNQLVATAGSVVEDGTAPTLDDALEQTKDVPLPIGWHFGEPSGQPGIDSLLDLHRIPSFGTGPMAWITKVTGLLLTAAAVGLGAPFWFDVLGRLMSFRATAKMGAKRPA